MLFGRGGRRVRVIVDLARVSRWRHRVHAYVVGRAAPWGAMSCGWVVEACIVCILVILHVVMIGNVGRHLGIHDKLSLLSLLHWSTEEMTSFLVSAILQLHDFELLYKGLGKLKLTALRYLIECFLKGLVSSHGCQITFVQAT